MCLPLTNTCGTVPQVFVNGRHIGGLEELQEWSRKAA
jgi:glutaredoxin